MAVIHPDSPAYSLGPGKDYGSDLSTDLLNTLPDISGASTRRDDDTGTGKNNESTFLFGEYVKVNEIWFYVSGYTTDSRVFYTDDGGSTWTQINGNMYGGDPGKWYRVRFPAKLMNGLRVRKNEHSEVEVHRALIPGETQSSINKTVFPDDGILESKAQVLTSQGNPVPNISGNVVITSEDGTEVVNKGKTTDSNGEAVINEITDVDGNYTEETYYDLTWDFAGFTSSTTFYVQQKSQSGTASDIQVYSNDGNPVRNAQVFVDGVFVGTTDKDGQLSVGYNKFPSKGSGSYTYVVVKGRRGVRKTVANGNEGYVRFGAPEAEDAANSLNTKSSRYGDVP